MTSRHNLTEQNPDVETFITNLKEKAENQVKVKFPSKIVELTNLLESADFNVKDPAQLHQPVNIPVPDAEAIKRGSSNNNGVSNEDPAESASPPTRGKKRKLEGARTISAPAAPATDGELDNGQIHGTKVLALVSGPVFCNKKITRLIDIVKPHIRELVEDSNLLKMWITFLIPKIEDGNNFGVSIQEDTLGEIRTVEAEAAAFYEQISRYFMGRGKIISKVAKYPHVEDYRKLISELDEKEFLSLRIVLSEVRNHYAALYDLITKNMEKIVRPRSSNTENLY